MSKKTKLPKNCVIEKFDDDRFTFRLIFRGGDCEDYVSELYTRHKGERFKSAAYEVCENLGWLTKPPDGPERIIRSLAEFLEWRGCGDNPYSWARAFYKYTDCGPWVVFIHKDTPARVDKWSIIVNRDKNGKLRAHPGGPPENRGELPPFDVIRRFGFDEKGLPIKEDREFLSSLKKYQTALEDYRGRLCKNDDLSFTCFPGPTNPLPGERRWILIGITMPRPETYTEVYYEDIGKDETTQQEVECNHSPYQDGSNPGPAETCRYCRGSGKRMDAVKTGRKIEVDFDKCVGLKFGSIVEGSDACSGPFEHMFPFKAADWTHDEEHMESETSFYWERDNGDFYCVRTEDDEWHVVSCWGDIKWDDEPPEPIKAAAEAAIKGDWQNEEGSNCFIKQTIPKMPGIYEVKPELHKDWKALPLGDTGAEIYTYDNDCTFD